MERDEPVPPLGRLRWRCMRRGLLELDLVLDRFAQRHLAALDARGLRALDELLDYEDPELWDIVSGRKQCEEPRLNEVVDLLRGV
jgi:succinate dehydrogenase flavin-adding protein (antitoxin of CptAB toxin-antitoxin module)